jgi:glutaredoxin 3
MSTELKLYSREWCSWCIDAKDYLSERGYKFVEIDVGQDRAAYEEMKELSDQTYVPTLAVGDGEKVLANFDTDQLEQFLTQHQIQP